MIDSPHASNKPGRVAKHVAKLLRHQIATPSALNATIANFIVCTKDSAAAEPATLARNIRQFFDGLRNFIIAQYGAAAPVMEPLTAAESDILNIIYKYRNDQGVCMTTMLPVMCGSGEP